VSARRGAVTELSSLTVRSSSYVMIGICFSPENRNSLCGNKVRIRGLFSLTTIGILDLRLISLLFVWSCGVGAHKASALCIPMVTVRGWAGGSPGQGRALQGLGGVPYCSAASLHRFLTTRKDYLTPCLSTLLHSGGRSVSSAPEFENR